MAGSSLVQRNDTNSRIIAIRHRGKTPPQEDIAMFTSENMVSIRNPFPRSAAKKPPIAMDSAIAPPPKSYASRILGRSNVSKLGQSQSESRSTSFTQEGIGGNQTPPMVTSSGVSTFASQHISASSFSTHSNNGNSINISNGNSISKVSSISPAAAMVSIETGLASVHLSSAQEEVHQDESSKSQHQHLHHRKLTNSSNVYTGELPRLGGTTNNNNNGRPPSHSTTTIHLGPTVGNNPNTTSPIFTPSEICLKNPKGLVGLQNLGNTCFMNSCLQCLSNIPILVKYFQSGLYLKEINETSPTKGQLATAFGDLIKILWSNPTFSSTRPVELKRLVGKIANRFMGYEQQDAQEFLRFLLDGLHEDLNQIKQKPAYYEIKEQDDANAGQIQKDQAISKEYWIFYQERNMSLLTELFCGQLRSEICCTICQHRSLCFDVFWDLSVPLPKKTTTSANNNNTTSTTITTTTTKSSSHHHLMRIFNKTSSTTTKTNVDDIDEMTTGTGSSSCTSGVSIQDCLRAYTEEEFLHEEDAYYCSKCKQHRAVSKKISIYRLPQILVIHLKRFSFSTFTRDKVNTAIQFPLQSLDVKDYCAKDGFIQESGSNGSTLYDLFGIVHHVGSLNRGHYTAECLNADTNEWYDFNDSIVSPLKTPHLSSSSAYILFFRRRK